MISPNPIRSERTIRKMASIAPLGGWRGASNSYSVACDIAGFIADREGASEAVELSKSIFDFCRVTEVTQARCAGTGPLPWPGLWLRNDRSRLPTQPSNQSHRK